MLERLHHVAVATPDPDASASSFERLFGRPVDGHSESDAGRSAWFALGNTAIELRPCEDGEGDRPLELGFVVADLEAAQRWAEGQGLGPTRQDATIALAPASTGGTQMTLVLETVARSPKPADPATVHGLDHVVIRTTDGGAARALYEQGLGVRVALDREFEQWGVRLIFCRLSGVTLEIAAGLDSSSAGNPIAKSEPPSVQPATRDALWGFTWQVANAEQARQRLHGLGFDVSEVRKGRKPGTQVFTVRDGTQGIPTLIIEPVSTAHTPE